MKSIAQKSSKLIKLVKLINPNSQFSSLGLSTEKPSFSYQFKSKPSALIPQIINSLKSNDINSWNSIPQLSPNFLNSIPPDNFLLITRSFDTSKSGIDFIQHLVSNPEKLNNDSMSFAMQAICELASREPEAGKRLLEVYDKVKEWNVILNVYCVIYLIKCLSRVDLIDNSVIIYNDLAPQMRNLRVRNAVIEELLRNCRLDHALQVLDEMLVPNSEVLADENTMQVVFAALLPGKGLGRWFSEDEFVQMVTRFGKIGFFPSSTMLTKLIADFCKRRKSDAALELLCTVMNLGGEVEVTLCNTLLTWLNKAREFDKMDCLMREMERKMIRPNVVTLGISLNYLCKAMRLDEALELFEKIRRGEISDVSKPDVIMYNTVIKGLCKIERSEDGLSLMRRMKTESGCSPNTITFNCLIDGFCKEAKLDKALELFGEMEKEGGQPNIRTVNVLVSGFCRDERVDDALQLYRKMQKKGLQGNGVTYTALITGFCSVNNVRKAMGLLREIKRYGKKCQPDVIAYFTLISGLSQTVLMDEAESVLSEMKSIGFCPDIACYNLMINGFCHENKLDKVHQMLKDMKTDRLHPDTGIYNTLIDFHCRNNLMEKALSLFDEMFARDVKPDTNTFNALFKALHEKNKLEKTYELMDKMTEQGCVPDSVTLEVLTQWLSAGGEAEKMRHFVESAASSPES